MRQSISYKIGFYRTVVPARLSFFEKRLVSNSYQTDFMPQISEFDITNVKATIMLDL
ncbi:hypothetical protein [Leptospira borgpetersenii]|uniref:hypothetical protein n=1 Tax=Leptospira borgpetersenii TaxID=174 RepID=UPI00030F6D2A|nr:hypothetical protein [Leptospira borgpetersenii]MBE8360456.1 hypothetical protein [Leptospira borgpetersenii serovar Hardjo-bovis]MBE8364961.1 hypothetical protein [Leptospira borgpetersenii serovar Balcanica]MBE8366213.1 hypothetical protein [Leptospira borgpetersenii serovar Balcanica]MBE8369984.1 hypothetical protein [Leptospira borgpetersenii serovar Hardjo-bovis]MBE8372956.1 hypothetical protein [Leptospira borgpetersenii serovar Hardjo-bovis]